MNYTGSAVRRSILAAFEREQDEGRVHTHPRTFARLRGSAVGEERPAFAAAAGVGQRLTHSGLTTTRTALASTRKWTPSSPMAL